MKAAPAVPTIRTVPGAAVTAGASPALCLALRPALESDRDFLRQVFISTRAAEFAGSDWTPAQIDDLLVQQFSLQDTYYRRHYPQAHFDLVTCNGTDAGRLYHHWGGTEVRLIDIALASSYRGVGLGTQLMQALVAEAARRGLAASLYVEMENPVRALYRRLGFVKAGENGVYEIMRRAVGPCPDGVPWGERSDLAQLFSQA
jgi:ribosomal protein S18 acetylase RimI-like enzyme